MPKFALKYIKKFKEKVNNKSLRIFVIIYLISSLLFDCLGAGNVPDNYKSVIMRSYDFCSIKNNTDILKILENEYSVKEEEYVYSIICKYWHLNEFKK